MAQSLSQKTVNTFIKGLITEAGELTFPEGASVDELNCDLIRDGSRRRRLGIALEDSASFIASSNTISTTGVISIGEWKNVANNPDLTFLVVQVNKKLLFFNKNTLPHSTSDASYSMTAFNLVGSNDLTKKLQFASLNGYLIVTSPEIKTFSLEANYTSSGLQPTLASEIVFNTRDFEWQGDIDDYTSAGATDIYRTYDTKNAGWVGTKGEAARSTWSTANSGNYPPLTHPWFSGKDSSNNFSASEWDKVYSGNTLTGNGHYILNFFNRTRTGLPTITLNERFKSVAAHSGRIFYGGLDRSEDSGTILFSKVIKSRKDFGICYQENDPTSEVLSDLLATDGGVIKIPEAINIKKLFSYQSTLFVFAENGVWAITGVDGIFSASSYGINRVSSIGIESPESFVEVDGLPFWWSDSGIHTLQTDPTSGQGKEQNISISTIQSFWDKIDAEARANVVATYDALNKRIYWGYANANEPIKSKINNFLILDLALNAFIPWKVEDQASSSYGVVGLNFFQGYGDTLLERNVQSGGDPYVAGQNEVISSATGTAGIVASDGFPIGFTYKIASAGTTDFTTIGSTNNTVGTTFTATAATITAGAFITGRKYRIVTTGNTDFVAIGSESNSSNTIFTATGAGSGTGTAIEVDLAGSGTGTADEMPDVVSSAASFFSSGPSIVTLIRRASDGAWTMGGFTSSTFLDWGDTNYTSFAETGYDFVGDLVTKKSAPYIAIYSRLTEEGFSGTAVSGYSSIRPSSLLVSAAWDFNDTFSATQQAYRLKYPVVVDPEDLSKFDYPEDVITTRLKMRGHGRSLRLKYSSEQGKDFILLGWGIVQGRNTRF